MTLGGVRAAAGVASTAGSRRPGRPASSTGTVLAHWPVQLTASTTARRSTHASTPAPRRAASTIESHHSLGVLHRAAAGSRRRRDRAVVATTRTRPVSDTQPDLRPAGAEVDREHEPLVAIGRRRGAVSVNRAARLSWLSSMSAITARMNSSASLGHAAGDAAVDRAASSGFSSLCSFAYGDRVGEVGRERVDDAGLGLRPGHRHVDRVRVLLAVEAPAAASA